MRVRTTALRAFVAALTIGALAACGGDDDDAASDTTEAEASETTTPAIVDTTAAEETDTTATETSDTTEAETDTTEAEDTETTTAGEPDGDFCTLVTPDQLAELTGLEWNEGEPGQDSCVWTTADGSSAFNVNGVEIPEATAEQAVAGAESTCDAGTVTDPGFADAGLAEGAFACLVTGVPTVVAYGEGVLLTFVAYTTVPDVRVEQVQSDLTSLVETVLSS